MKFSSVQEEISQDVSATEQAPNDARQQMRVTVGKTEELVRA